MKFFKLRQKIAAILKPSKAKAYARKLAAEQAKMKALRTYDASTALRDVYLALPRKTEAERLWRVQLLDILAERRRELSRAKSTKRKTSSRQAA